MKKYKNKLSNEVLERLRKMAENLPELDNVDAYGRPIYSTRMVLGKELNEAGERDWNGMPFKDDEKYGCHVKMVENYFEGLKKAYQVSGDRGIQVYL